MEDKPDYPVEVAPLPKGSMEIKASSPSGRVEGHLMDTGLNRLEFGAVFTPGVRVPNIYCCFLSVCSRPLRA